MDELFSGANQLRPMLCQGAAMLRDESSGGVVDSD